MTFIGDLFHHFPGERTFFDMFAPFVFDDGVSFPQSVGGNRGRDVVRNMHVDIVTEEFYPSRVVAMNLKKSIYYH